MFAGASSTDSAAYASVFRPVVIGPTFRANPDIALASDKRDWVSMARS